MGQVVVHARAGERNQDAYKGKKMSEALCFYLVRQEEGTKKVQWCGLVLKHHKRKADGECFL